MNKKIKLLVSALISSCASLSLAGGYIGASVGQTEIDVSGFDDGNSVAISGGYKINENFAIELSYVDLGESEDEFDLGYKIEIDGFNVAAVGIMPVSEHVEIFAKAGLFMWDAELDEGDFGETGSDDGTDLSIGIGASVNLTEQFSLVFEFQRFDLDGGDADNISIGARLNF